MTAETSLAEETTTLENFDLSDVLAVTTGKVTRAGQSFALGGGVDQVVEHLIGRSVSDLPRDRLAAREEAFKQHPRLADVDTAGLTPRDGARWLMEQERRFGHQLPLRGGEDREARRRAQRGF